MGAYVLGDVIKRWELEKLTADQAIGQMLLHIRDLEQRLGELEARVSRSSRAERGGNGRRRPAERPEPTSERPVIRRE